MLPENMDLLYLTDKIPVTIIKFQWETPLLSLKMVAD